MLRAAPFGLWPRAHRSVITSCLVTSGFASLWLVANELEDPFGHDPNDIPMAEYHEEFIEALKSSLDHPWLLTDMWTVSSGSWQPPPSRRAGTHPPLPQASRPLAGPEHRPAPRVGREQVLPSMRAVGHGRCRGRILWQMK